MSLTLYGYWRATAPYRVRIGLALKGLAYDYRAVNLAGGDQHAEDYRAVNAQALTPALGIGAGVFLNQSLAILEWLDETHPEPPLLPGDALGRARVRAIAGMIACDMHPLNNLRVLQELARRGQDEDARNAWARRWIEDGFKALEPMVAAEGRGWAYGDTPTLADCCLIPQVFSAGRFGVDMSAFPAIAAIAARAEGHPAFQAAHPSRQPDAV